MLDIEERPSHIRIARWASQRQESQRSEWPLSYCIHLTNFQVAEMTKKLGHLTPEDWDTLFQHHIEGYEILLVIPEGRLPS